jgi:alginate O-acetyltransferase complex protein AlgI
MYLPLMLFNSFQFLFVFLPVTLAGALWLQQRNTMAFIWWTITASLIFYGAWQVQTLWVLCVSLVVNYGVALLIDRSAGLPRRLWLTAGLVWNLGLLGYFKYTNFAGDLIGQLFGDDPGWAHVVLPVGISFFTFQKIAFLVDAYRGDVASRSFSRFCLFVMFFPQLIAGPIVHHLEFIPQLDRKNTQVLRNVAIGLTVLTIGLVKKLYIADTAAIPASAVFDAVAVGAQPSFADAWFGAIAYSVQIYFDFSAYSDMAIGLARMFGLDLPINFASPYKATSIIDFWRRWHITLSRFLRDYLYGPLGGNRHGVARQRINLLATMVLGGFWHGAGFTFLIWGFMHGLYLLAAHAFARSAIGMRARSLWGWSALTWVLTILAVVIAWVPFRADGITTTLQIWRAMTDVGSLAGGFAIAPDDYEIQVFASLVFAFLAPNVYEVFRRYKLGLPSPGYSATFLDPDSPASGWMARVSPAFTPTTAVLLGIVVAAVVLKLNDISEFIYFQF